MKKPQVTLYLRNRCHLCEEAKEIIEELKKDFDFDYEEVDIDSSDELIEKYGIMIPVLNIDGVDAQYGVIDKKFIYKAFTLKNQC